MSANASNAHANPMGPVVKKTPFELLCAHAAVCLEYEERKLRELSLPPIATLESEVKESADKATSPSVEPLTAGEATAELPSIRVILPPRIPHKSPDCLAPPALPSRPITGNSRTRKTKAKPRKSHPATNLAEQENPSTASAKGAASSKPGRAKRVVEKSDRVLRARKSLMPVQPMGPTEPLPEDPAEKMDEDEDEWRDTPVVPMVTEPLPEDPAEKMVEDENEWRDLTPPPVLPMVKKVVDFSGGYDYSAVWGTVRRPRVNLRHGAY
ncbi:hypothetical protein B0H34DRAFT_69811 [Crassisporium funariophilum]|nr:hypothetical protein B0H34DRAFT_69811 [Crassisporium funariophilum]